MERAKLTLISRRAYIAMLCMTLGALGLLILLGFLHEAEHSRDDLSQLSDLLGTTMAIGILLTMITYTTWRILAGGTAEDEGSASFDSQSGGGAE